MITILVTGHGNFATGLLSAANLISGVHEQVCGVDFVQGDSTDDLRAKLSAVVAQAPGELLVLTDIAGGSPYNLAVTIKSEQPGRVMEVASGANIPMLISAIMEREGQTAAELADSVIETAARAVKRFQFKKIVMQAQDDGI